MASDLAGYTFDERWQHYFDLLSKGQWGEFVGRAELRDRKFEEHLKLVPQLIYIAQAFATAPLVATNVNQVIPGCTSEVLRLKTGDLLEFTGSVKIEITTGGGDGVAAGQVTGMTGGPALTGVDLGFKSSVAGDYSSGQSHTWYYVAEENADYTVDLLGRYQTAGVTFGDECVLQWKVWR